MKLKKARKVTASITLDSGQTVEAERIGKGRFCEAFRKDEDVYLVCPDDDYSKEVFQLTRPLPHLPHCESLGYVEGQDRRIFAMPYYEPLKAKHKPAWQMFRALQSSLDDAWHQIRSEQRSKDRRFNPHLGYDVMQRTISLLPDRVNPGDWSTSSLKRSLEELASAASNYGSSWTFDVSKCNFGVVPMPHGNGAKRDKPSFRLILRDVVFDLEKNVV